MRIVDNFLCDPFAFRQVALSHSFGNIKAFDGQTYDRVMPYESAEVQANVEGLYGPVLWLGSGFRLNYRGELPNNGRHIDVGWGTHALVLYLSTKGVGVTGTAFWSSTDEDARMLDFCNEKFNSAVMYKSNQPHSRWPLEAYGDCPENGRLVFVGFFSPIEELSDA